MTRIDTDTFLFRCYHHDRIVQINRRTLVSEVDIVLLLFCSEKVESLRLLAGL